MSRDYANEYQRGRGLSQSMPECACGHFAELHDRAGWCMRPGCECTAVVVASVRTRRRYERQK